MSDEVGTNRIALDHPARRAAVIAVIAAVLLAGLLLLERTGPSPVRNLKNISSGKAAAASASGPVQQSAAVAGTSASPSRLANASISASGKSQLTTSSSLNAQQLCTAFVAGTAPTVSTVTYDSKNGTISKILVPGSFFYFVSIPVATAGPQSFTISQSTTYAPTTGTQFFDASQGGGGEAFDGSCNQLGSTETGGSDSLTVSFTASSPGNYIVAVHYMTHSVIGSSPASDTPGFSYPYMFSTGGVSGSTSGLSLTHT
jgi:hypothetical protein